MSMTVTHTMELFLSGSWVDVTADVIAGSIVCSYGIDGDSPNDRVASAGTLTFALDNSIHNSAGVVGYYSPLNANKRSGFDYGVKVRWHLTDGSNTSYKFLGHLSEIDPAAGIHGERIVRCQAVDWMDDAAQLTCPDIAAQLNQRSDQIITTIINALAAGDQPAATSIETGLSSFAYALDGGVTSATPIVREIINQVCMSEFGYGYTKGDSTQGGTFVFESRAHREKNPATLATLTDAEIDAGGDLDTPSSRDDIYSKYRVVVAPVRVDASATTVIFSLQTATVFVAAGDTNTSIFGPYRDPDTNDYIGGTDTVTPQAATDYVANAAANGSGADITAAFTVTASTTGSGVRWTIANTGSQDGYITHLQLRGRAIRRYPTPIEKTVTNAYGNRVLEIDMPFQNDVSFASDVATRMSGLYASPFGHVHAVRFNANRSSTLMGYAINREIGDRVNVSETVTGISAPFTVNKVTLEMLANNILFCTWGLEPVPDTTAYWLIGTTGVSEIGTTTYVGF